MCLPFPRGRRVWNAALVTWLLAGCSATYTSFDIDGAGRGPALWEAVGDEVVLHFEDGSSARGVLSHVGEDSVALQGESLRASFPRDAVTRVLRAEDPQWAGFLAGAVGVGLVLFLAVILAFSAFPPGPAP